MRKLLFLLLITCLFTGYTTNAQTFSKIGFKGGFALSGISTFNNKPIKSGDKLNAFVSDSTFFFNSVSVDLGITAELFNSKYFCLSAELHYLQKGDARVEYFTPDVQIRENGSFDAAGNLDDKAYYLSLQILPRVRIPLSYEGDNYYFFGGPVFDLKLSDKSEFSNSNFIINQKRTDVGIALGGGFELADALGIELKYQYDFTGPYSFIYKGEEIVRRYNCFVISLSYTLVNKTTLFNL